MSGKLILQMLIAVLRFGTVLNQAGTDGYTFLTLKGTVDLSAAPKPYVSFWLRRGDGGGGYCSFEVSSDGGQTWKVIQRPNFNGTAYTQELYSLADYRQKNVLIRIGVYSPYGTYYLDDIEIADSTGYATGIRDFAGIIPENFELSQNYPNPFNPSTTIRYALPVESKVSLTIYNLLGQRIAQLADGIQSAGYHETVFNASNLASGVYLYSINAVSSDGTKNFVVTKKLVLLK